MSPDRARPLTQLLVAEAGESSKPATFECACAPSDDVRPLRCSDDSPACQVVSLTGIAMQICLRTCSSRSCWSSSKPSFLPARRAVTKADVSAS